MLSDQGVAGATGRRASLIGGGVGGTATDLDEQLQRELRAASAAELSLTAPTAGIGQSLVALLMAVVVWPDLPAIGIVAWVLLVTTAGAVRLAVAWRPAAGGSSEPTLVVLRATVFLQGLIWGLGALLSARALPPDHLSLVLVIFAGLIAAASSTLVADLASFEQFTGALLLPLLAGVLLAGQGRLYLTLTALIGAFGAAMTVLHRRAHRGFVLRWRLTRQLAASEAVAQRERAFLDSLLVAAPTAIATLTADGSIMGVNPAFERLFGYEAADVIGRNLNDLIVPDENRAHALEMDHELQRGKTQVMQLARRHRDGRMIPVLASAALVPEAGGGPSGTSFVLYDDLTVVKQAEDAMRAARDAAEQATRAKSSFLANMSHEIRTPMNGVLGMLELLLETPLTPDQRSSAELAKGSAEGLVDLINHILDFSKLEAGQWQVEHVPYDLHGVIDAVIRLLANRPAAGHAKLVARIAPEVPRMVSGDPGRLRQILTNLVGNAQKFTPGGEVVLDVVLAHPDRHLVRFTVRDTGIGIPADKLEHMFEEFTQADASTTRRYGGTGLGLAISRQLVRLLGGEIGVTSEVGRGSEFTFAIPLPPARDAQAPGTASADADVRIAGKRVLVVDDDTTNRRIVIETLTSAGAVVDEVPDAALGLRTLREAASRGAAYDVAVVDVLMPGVGGFELARRVRDDVALQGLKIVLCTSAGERGDAQRAVEAGVAGYLTKPLARVSLLEVVVRVLNTRAPEGGTGRLITRHTIEEARRRLKILLAEDNPVNQKVAAELLRRRGHVVEVVDNGRAAVEAASNARFDAVLMDIQMPEMDGVAATRSIRRQPAGAALPIIALTAHALGEERQQCLDAGMNAYVVKPFRPHELFAAVEGWGDGTPDREAVPVTAATPSLAVDLAALRRRLGDAGTDDMVASLVTLFLEDAPGRLRAVIDAFASGNAANVASAAHAFKSAAAALAARGLADGLAAMERAARADDLPTARSTLETVQRAYDEALMQLRPPPGPPA
jgi:two-component system sensor histidine kinase/response regulator